MRLIPNDIESLLPCDGFDSLLMLQCYAVQMSVNATNGMNEGDDGCELFVVVGETDSS